MRTLKKLLVASLLLVSSLAHGAVVIARPVIISRPPVISRPAVVSAPKPAVAKPVTLPASSKQKSISVPVLTPPVVIPRSPPSLDDCEKKAVWC